MKKLALLAAALLAGCAAQSQGYPQLALTPDIARQMDAPTLCFGLLTFRPENVLRAQAEISRRSIDCSQHAEAVRSMYQTRVAEDAAIAAQQRQAAAPAPAYQPIPMPKLEWPQIPQQQSPRAINCTTTQFGGQLQTRCQ